MSTTITNRLIAAFGGFLLVLAMGLAMASPASALGGYNLVNNSGYSAQPILVCADNGDCTTVGLGGSAYQGSYWSPDHVAVCAYCTAQYRVVVGNYYTTGWVTQEGGRYPGTWIDSGALFRMWGGKDVMVQVVMSKSNP